MVERKQLLAKAIAEINVQKKASLYGEVFTLAQRVREYLIGKLIESGYDPVLILDYKESV